MGSKKTLIMSAAALSALVFAGWSCGGSSGVSNVEPDETPTEKTYQNSEWGVSFKYPADWNYREYVETIEGEEITTLAFSDQELPETLPPEPSFPVMVFRGEGLIDDAMSDYEDAVSTNDVTLGERSSKKVVYYSEFLEQNEFVYLTSLRSGFLRFFAPEGTSYAAVAENMISTLVETE